MFRNICPEHDRFLLTDLFKRTSVLQPQPLSQTLLTAFIGHFTLGSSSWHQTAYGSQTEESNWSVKEGERRCTMLQNRRERLCMKELALVISKATFFCFFVFLFAFSKKSKKKQQVQVTNKNCHCRSKNKRERAVTMVTCTILYVFISVMTLSQIECLYEND